ncbi:MULTISPECIES: hypothetical protein [Arenibacter]|uniref:hypothetical protein n=1 Tax=Arenibacter TaxID=178469 RepID=UPI0004DF4B02|nr:MULTISPECIES: hypothetical protein [Arenibacter]GBF18509.1 hypothetical protein C21_00667 [Arenibacter sp. NBRC 103722]
MTKNHFLFLKQIIVSFIVITSLAWAVLFLFNSDENSKHFIVVDAKLTSIRKESSEILENLINENQVTFDPTNGLKIEQVLRNLKYSEKKRILLLGSSQLITLNDDWSYDNYLRRVDKLLEKEFNNEVIVYNLSMGGMTVSEKRKVLKKVQEILNFDIIIISIGPYDCRELDTRKGIEDIENITFEKIDRKGTYLKGKSIFNEISISGINNSVENIFNKQLIRWSSFYSYKSAIKTWFGTEIDNILAFKKEDKQLKPAEWRTFNQNLDNKSGWSNDISHSGKKSLKIIKSDSSSTASWKGSKILLEKPTNKLVLGGWSKCKNLFGTKLYCIDFKIDFIDGSETWYYKGLEFSSEISQWQNVEEIVQFDKEVKSISPYLIVAQGSGTAWFDDIYVKPIYEIVDKNIVFNHNMEEKSQIKDVYTLKFDNDIWEDIIENSGNLVDYFSNTEDSNTKKYLLIPPVYNSEIKKGYEQDYFVEKFVTNLKDKCQKGNIKLINASELLDETHFIEFESGEKKGLVEPLHFGSAGHKKLAGFIKNELNL